MIKHWINGREVESKDVFVNYNPATGDAIGEVASGGAEEVAQAVAAAAEQLGAEREGRRIGDHGLEPGIVAPGFAQCAPIAFRTFQRALVALGAH